MTGIFAGVRKGDAVLAALATALGVLLMIENIYAGPHPDARVDSHSWLMVPVFAAATLPILWRRRNMLAVLAITAAALAVHVLAFGWIVRCGAGLPLSFALAYGVGRLSRGRTSYLGLAATIGVQFLVLVKDSAAGLGILPVTAVIGVVFWAVGGQLARRAARSSAPQSAPTDTAIPVPARV